jgi:hypothetical protein
MKFPFIHNWTYRGTECAAQQKPFFATKPTAVYEYGTSTQGAVSTSIRRTGDASGLLSIEPAVGCKAITAMVLVYDRSQIREMAFPIQFGTYSGGLTDRIRRDGAHVELRGIDKGVGNGSCSVNLLWANMDRKTQ